jgi:hypothetical protein
VADLKSHKASPTRTICEVLREIYDELEEMHGVERAIELLEEAYDMGKRMNKKLLEYKNKGFDLPANPNFEKSVMRREHRK